MAKSNFIDNLPATKPISRLWMAPAGMAADAKMFFKVTGQLLVKAGILTDLDRSLFTELALLYGDLKKLRRDLDELGFVIPDKQGSFKRNPAATAYKDLLIQYLRIGQKFGLSPSDRDKMDFKVDDTAEDATRKDIFGE